jgi:RNA recognition motif-containing protein
MSTNLYVGNLSFGTDDSALNDLFAEFGTVESAKVIADRDSGRSRGFGFVEMSSGEEAEAAISALDGKEVDGRALKVNQAKPKENRSGGGGGYGGQRY